MYCPNCGTKAAENAKFCMECGTKLILPQTENRAVEMPTPLPKWLEGLPPRLQKARWVGEQDKDQEALELAQEEMKEAPSLQALDIIFSSYAALNQFDKAQETVAEMEKRGASQAWIDLNRAYLYIAQEKCKEANPLLEKTIAHKEDLPSKYQELLSFFGLAVVQSALEKEPLKTLEKALQLKDYAPVALLAAIHFMRAACYTQKEQYNQAYQALAAADKAGYKKDSDFYFCRALAGQESEHFDTFLADINEALKSEDAQTRTQSYWRRGLYYYNKDEDEKAYQDFMAAQKEGLEQSIDFCYFRAMAGFACGQLEYIRQDIEYILNSDATESVKKIARQLQEKLDGNTSQAIVTDEVLQEARGKFYDKTLEIIEKYKEEEGLHTSVAMFSSDNLKYMMKHSVRNSLNYWEETFSSVMDSQLQTDFIAAKKEIKRFVSENFNTVADRADALIDEVMENVPEDSWLEFGKNALKGALTGYLTGGLGVLGMMFDQAEENKTMNKTVNKWNTYVQQMLEEYDEVYSHIIKRMTELIDKYHIPTEISDTDEEEDD